MRSDRYTKAVLTVIAVCLSILTLTMIGLPDFTARAEATAAPSPATAESAAPPEMHVELVQARLGAEQTHPSPGEEYFAPAQGSTPRSATLPLRWRVSLAANWNTDNIGSDECFTALTLTGVSPTSIAVEVEFFNNSAVSLGTVSTTAFSERTTTVRTISGGGWTPSPFVSNAAVNTGNFTGGYARVHADDPRVLVGAFYKCREEFGGIRSLSGIPVFPVGATAEYFRAGMPATWTPPMAAPEVPE